MKISRTLRYFAGAIVFLGLLSFCLPAPLQSHKPAILGKWYYGSSGQYYKTVERGDIARWYNFKSDSRVEFSSCTDWCGCMRMTLAGKYEWENDSIISVSFTKTQRELDRQTGWINLEQPQNKRLKISKLKEKGLKIEEIK